MNKFDIWLANLNPNKGNEPGKVRPVILLQSNLLNKIGHQTIIICPITTNLSSRSNLLRVFLSKEAVGLDFDSEVLIDQIRAVDRIRLIEKINTKSLSNSKKEEIRVKLLDILDF